MTNTTNTKVNSILESVKLHYTESEDQSGAFTPQHVCYTCVIKHNNKQLTTPYICNPNFSRVTVPEVLYCLFSDMSCYESAFNVDDFLKEFGYTDSLENVRKGEKIYKQCGRIKAALHRLFNTDEIETLQEYFSEY